MGPIITSSSATSLSLWSTVMLRAWKRSDMLQDYDRSGSVKNACGSGSPMDMNLSKGNQLYSSSIITGVHPYAALSTCSRPRRENLTLKNVEYCDLGWNRSSHMDSTTNPHFARQTLYKYMAQLLVTMLPIWKFWKTHSTCAKRFAQQHQTGFGLESIAVFSYV